MLDAVRVQNFRCLRDVNLELGPLTVFVGPNASGKTAIADALTTRDLSAPTDYWHLDKDASVAIAALPLDPKWKINKSFRMPEGRQRLSLLPSMLRSALPANEAWALGPDGRNLSNLFDTLSRPDQDRFVIEFTRLVPMYGDVKARARGGLKSLEFQDRWKSDLWFEAGQVSDGTMVAAAVVALSYQRDVPDLLVIEDPDHGLHPYLQLRVVEILRALTRGEIGPRPIQVVCTTHSKSFLDHLEPEEVRFLSRDRETGETKVARAPTDSPRWRDVYDRYQKSMGDLWMTGSLGGVPGV